ncbi:FAD-dependent oxidoreductase [Candidatus Dependentiae bacterium]|nr:FAD-dependent oxidoreductase [Candidatus Dependentiae bacterium]
MHTTYVVIGSSAAGTAALSTLKRLKPHSTIICITKNKSVDYNTCLLASYVAQEKTLNDIALLNPDIMWHRGKVVTQINRQDKCVMLSTGETIAYDYLLLTLGTQVHKQDYSRYTLTHEKVRGIENFYTLEDAENIKEFIKQFTVTTAVVVGAGLTGIECADALVKLGIEVTLIEKSTRLLPKLLDTDSALWLAEQLAVASPKIRIITDDTVKDICHKHSRVTKVIMGSGSVINTQLVVFALGGKPAVTLAQQAGLAIDQGIKVDSCFKTQDAHIYAAGDCALVKNKITREPVLSCTWPDAIIQGMLAAYAMTGQSKVYPGITPLYTSQFFGIPFACLGEKAHTTSVVYSGVKAGVPYYYSFFLDTDKKITGSVLLGSREYMSKVKKIIETQESFEPLKTELDKDLC